MCLPREISDVPNEPRMLCEDCALREGFRVEHAADGSFTIWPASNETDTARPRPWIVRAVNAHDALVAACEAFVELNDALRMGNAHCAPTGRINKGAALRAFYELTVDARAALALARGEK